jgi:hypothetical protein
MITVKSYGSRLAIATLLGQQRQVSYAASRALNNVAFAANAEIKNTMRSTFKGGATRYVQNAFRIIKADRNNLKAIVRLRDDAPDGGSNYTKMLRHLFTGGTRDWKRIEAKLRYLKLVPAGYMVVPGGACPLDRFGNIMRTQFAEMLTVLRSSIRNLKIYYSRTRRTDGKQLKEVGFFVIQPGVNSHLHPGIWRRIEHGGYSSVVQPYILFVRPGKWGRFIDLHAIGDRVVSSRWESEFERELSKALSTAR